MTSVTRIGDTVRRSRGPWSPAVHFLLQHLESREFRMAPRFLGIDTDGREVLTYIAGDSGFFSPDRVVPHELWSDHILVEAASLLRQFHDATASLALPAGVEWEPSQRNPAPHDVICHGDFAPYNCIFHHGHLVAAIDFDGASPGSRAWDLAYAAYTFVPLYDDGRCLAVGLTEIPDRGRRLHLLCDAYGLEDRVGFVSSIERRVQAIVAMIQTNAAAGDARFQRKIDEGHIVDYVTDLGYLRQNRSVLQAALDEK